MTDEKNGKHGPEHKTETDKVSTSERVVVGTPITTQSDNVLKQRSEEQSKLVTFKLTSEKQSSFTIVDEKGRESRDMRARRAEPSKPEHPHQEDGRHATQRCLDDAAAKWGKAAVQEIKIDKNDVNAALALAVLGPGAYKLIGHDHAAAFGKTVLEHCAPLVHEAVKGVSPPVPESLAKVKSNPEDDKKFEHAGKVFLDSCAKSYGEDAVKQLHIDPKDWGATIGLFVVGPGAYKAMGHDAAQSLGKQAFLFGIAPAFGAGNEAQRAVKDVGALGTEGAINAMIGYGAGFIARHFPATAIPMAIGGGMVAAKDQFDPRTQAQNHELFGINRSADHLSNSQMLAAGHETAGIMGPGIFHGLFGAATGGAGFAHGEAKAAELSALKAAGAGRNAALEAGAAARQGEHQINHVEYQTNRVEHQINKVEHHTENKAVMQKEHVRIMSASEKQAVVEKSGYGFDYKIGGETFKLLDSGDWAKGGVESPKGLVTNFISPGIKLHVEASSLNDLARLQKVLIPALSKDPELAAMVPLWKTDPRTFSKAMTTAEADAPLKAQDAKAFTLYVKDPDRVKYVQEKLDSIIDKNGLSLAKRADSGNLDLVTGKSNRVGISREKWEEASAIAENGKVFNGAKVGPLIEEKINARFHTERLSEEQLHTLEKETGLKPNTLMYANDGKMMLRSMNSNSSRSEGKMYLSESGSGKQFGELTDRPAMYALSDHFKVDQFAAFQAERPTSIKVSLEPGEVQVITASIPSRAKTPDGASVSGSPVHAVETTITVGSDAKGSYVIDSKNPVYTWGLVAKNNMLAKGATLHPPGTRVYAEQNQLVTLGEPNGPHLDLFATHNEIVPAASASRSPLLETAAESARKGDASALIARDAGADIAPPTFDRMVFEGKFISIKKSELVIGRSSGDLLPADAASTSSKHAALRLDPDGNFYLRDLGSRNGTSVNGVKIKVYANESVAKGVSLRPGDKVGVPAPDVEYIFTGLKDAPLQRLRPGEVLEYLVSKTEDNSISHPAAIGQSRQLQVNHEFSGKLTSGFQDIPNKTILGRLGLSEGGDPTTVFAPEQDARLRHLFKSAHTRFDSMKGQKSEVELRAALAELAHDSLTPKGPWTEAHIDTAYERFCEKNAGKQILLGEYLRQAEQHIGGGTCTQQTLLYKALCDEFGLETKIVRGWAANAVGIKPDAQDFLPNHTWAVARVDGQDLVFDPRNEIHGEPVANIGHYHEGKLITGSKLESDPAAEFNETDRINPRQLKLNDALIYEGTEWRFEGLDKRTGHIMLTQSLKKPIAMDEFNRLNGNVIPQRPVNSNWKPQMYKVQRSNGEIENDWYFGGWQPSSRIGDPIQYILIRTKDISVPPESVTRRV